MFRLSVIILIINSCILIFGCKSNTGSSTTADYIGKEKFVRQIPEADTERSYDYPQPIPLSDSAAKAVETRRFRGTGISDVEVYAFLEDYLARTRDTFSAIDPWPTRLHADSAYLKGMLVKDVDQQKKQTAMIISLARPVFINQQDYKSMLRQLLRYKDFQWPLNKLKCRYTINQGKKNYKPGEKYDVYYFSIPLFSKDKQTAIFTVNYHCAGLCGGGETCMYYKKNGHWVDKSNRFTMSWVY